MTTTSSKEATVVLILYTKYVLVKTKFVVFYDFLKIDCYLMSSKQYFSYVHSENQHTVNNVGKKVKKWQMGGHVDRSVDCHRIPRT
jgi:hypothetical protein